MLLEIVSVLFGILIGVGLLLALAYGAMRMFFNPKDANYINTRCRTHAHCSRCDELLMSLEDEPGPLCNDCETEDVE